MQPDETTTRLDRFLQQKLSSLSRTEVHHLIRTRQARVNGRYSDKGQRLEMGQEVTAEVATHLSSNPSLQLPILYEDDSCLVLSKPCGLPTVARHLSDTRTVANYLVAITSESDLAAEHPREAGLVHRLDTETSGLLVAAKNKIAYQSLRKQFRHRSIYKEYRAVVLGRFGWEGTFAFNLAPSGKKGRRMKLVCLPNGKEAVSHYKVIAKEEERSALRIIIKTGVRHQIRAHLSFLGFPISGDRLYGESGSSAPRLCLHAHVIEFRQPTTGRSIRITDPLPDDFPTTASG